MNFLIKHIINRFFTSSKTQDCQNVIYHLVENVVFKNHSLFRCFHVKHRKWTKYVPKNYTLIEQTNRGFLNSSVMFFLHEREI